MNINSNCFCLRIYRFYESIFLTRYLIQFLSRPVKIVGVCLPPRPYDFTGFPVSSGNTPRTSGSFPAAGTITRPAAGSGRNPGRQSGHDPDDRHDRKLSTPDRLDDRTFSTPLQDTAGAAPYFSRHRRNNPLPNIFYIIHIRTPEKTYTFDTCTGRKLTGKNLHLTGKNLHPRPEKTYTLTGKNLHP